MGIGKKILMGAGGLLGLLAIAAGGLLYKASSTLSDPVEAPLPPLKAATDPQALERGKHLFTTVCIRNPEATVPGTQMPTYAELIDDAQAMTLAAWVQNQATTIP